MKVHLTPSLLVPLQGDCQTREEAVTLGVGLCNNGFMHHGNLSLPFSPASWGRGSALLNDFFFLFNFRGRERAGGEGQRERERESQAGSMLSVQSLMWGWIPRP